MVFPYPGEDKGSFGDLNSAGGSVTAEDDSEACWRQPKPIVAKKYSSLAVFTLLSSFFSPFTRLHFPQALPAPLLSAALANSLHHCFALFSLRHVSSQALSVLLFA